MTRKSKLHIGIVGACGRGASFKAACDALETVRIHAVCDTNAEGLAAAATRLGAGETYTDYETMLAQSDLDAVIIGTPMPLHVPQAIAALQSNLHVLSEVPAGVSVQECQALVAASQASRGVYMMAENYTYIKANAMVREMVRRGAFGTPYYAEGEYIHELKGLNEITTWRRQWQTGINGVTYGTHSLGPILQWFPGDRVVSVSCVGSGHHYRDPRGKEYENEESSVMLCKMKNGGLIKIRVDMLSDRPHAMTNYQLQGTDGAYESARAAGEKNRIWLRSHAPDMHNWRDLAELETEFVPEMWRVAGEVAAKAGHGGGDYFEVLDFVDAALGKRPCDIGIHEAMDMTLPGLISQQSILDGGRWLAVPDSRTWGAASAPRPPQLRMLWPLARLAQPPPVELAPGYMLRQYRDTDLDAYLALMNKAGFLNWNNMDAVQRSVLPGGFFVIENQATGALVATTMATHNPVPGLSQAGELGWVAGDPEHKGKGLGQAACAAVVAHFLKLGYSHIYLKTDDWRLPAIRIYLKLGFEPDLFADGMRERWDKVRSELGV